MDLIERSRVAEVWHEGQDTIVLTEGQQLKIETTPTGSEILDVEVPAGKTWSVAITVYVTET